MGIIGVSGSLSNNNGVSLNGPGRTKQMYRSSDSVRIQVTLHFVEPNASDKVTFGKWIIREGKEDDTS